MKGPIINGKPFTSVHHSPENGVHADWGPKGDRMHVPYEGQTTLSTFKIGGSPGPANDSLLAGLGGTFKPKA